MPDGRPGPDFRRGLEGEKRMRRLLSSVVAAAVAMVVLTTTVVMAQVSADHWLGGAVRIGTSTTICNGSAEGAIRWSSVNGSHEMCDGVGWRPFIASIPTVQLIVLPSVATTMNVDGTCGTAWCDGTPALFTVTNAGANTSGVIATGLTESTHF